MAVDVATDWSAAGNASALFPLDLAQEYTRTHLARVLPAYLVAMAPFSAAMWYTIDVVTSQHRSALPSACVLLVAATLWRWAWLAVVQRRVQEDVRGEPPLPVRRRLGAILLARLYGAAAIFWGSFIVIPALYGFFVSAFVTPVLLEGDGPVFPELKRAAGMVHRATGRLARMTGALSLLALFAFLNVWVLQILMLTTLLPALLGLDVADLTLTMSSMGWFLFLLYGLFLCFDLYWTVASVMVFYHLQARRLGSDLRSRLQTLRLAEDRTG